MATKKKTSGIGGPVPPKPPTKSTDKSNSLPATMGKRMRASRAEVKSSVTGARQIASVNRTRNAQAQAANAAKPNRITASPKPRAQTMAQKQAEILAAKRAASARNRPAPRPKKDAAPRYPRNANQQAKLPGAL